MGAKIKEKICKCQKLLVILHIIYDVLNRKIKFNA